MSPTTTFFLSTSIFLILFASTLLSTFIQATILNDPVSPPVFVYVHPWATEDDFLSLDCLIRATQFGPDDTFSLIIETASVSDIALVNTYNANLHELHLHHAQGLQSTSTDQQQTEQLYQTHYSSSQHDPMYSQDTNHYLAEDLDNTVQSTTTGRRSGTKFTTNSSPLNTAYIPTQLLHNPSEHVIREHTSAKLGEQKIFTSSLKDTITPFISVSLLSFINRQQYGEISHPVITKTNTKIENYKLRWPTEAQDSTENYLNFRLVPDPAEHHEDQLSFIVTFIYNHIDPTTKQPHEVKKQKTITQRTSLALDVDIQNFPTNHTTEKKSTFYNKFDMFFTELRYQLRSMELALHGNHQFVGDFSTCTINGTKIQQATQKDIGYNLTVFNTLMGQTTGGYFSLECPDAYIESYSQEAFSKTSVLSITGQDVVFWKDSTVFPARGILVENMRYEFFPDYLFYWFTIVTMFLLSALFSYAVVWYWNSGHKQVIVS